MHALSGTLLRHFLTLFYLISELSSFRNLLHLGMYLIPEFNLIYFIPEFILFRNLFYFAPYLLITVSNYFGVGILYHLRDFHVTDIIFRMIMDVSI